MKHCTIPSWLVLGSLCILGSLACRIEPDAFDDNFEGPQGRIEFSWSDEESRLEALAQGELSFNAADSGLDSISEGGSFSVTEAAGGRTRKWEARPNPDGTLSTTYSVNGQPTEMDEEARQWLARTLTRVLRETGFDAAARTRRILESRGAEDVVAEIAQIRSGRSREIYIGELLGASDLTEDQLCRLARLARDGSSSELTRMVELLAERRPGSLALTSQLIETVKGIKSSSLRRQAIEEILRQRDLNVDSTVALADSAGGIRADSEKAGVILAIAEKSPKTAETANAFVEAASTIRSSSEKSRVLRALVAKPGVDAAVQAKAAAAIGEIHSASEKAAALTALAEILQSDNEAAFDAFLAAVATVEAPSEQERALSALLARSDLGAGVLQKTLSFARTRLPEGPVRQRLVEKIQRKL